MLRIVVAAAVVALASAEVKMGSDVFKVDMTTGEYLVNDTAITVQDDIDVTGDSANQKSARIGASLGKKLAEAELYYKIDEINAATKALETANEELEKIKVAAAEKARAGPQLLVDLQKQLNEMASKPAVINGVNDCAEGRCGTDGTDTFLVQLDGEIYADVAGLVECELTIDGKAYYTPGLGKTTGVSGRHSAVVCNAGPLPPSAVAKKTVSAAIAVRVGSSATLQVATGKKATLVLAATGAALHPRQSSTAAPHVIKFSALDSKGSYTMDLLILDPDTKFAEVTAVFSGADKVMTKVELVRIKDVSASMGMGSYHMGIKFTPDAKVKGKHDFTLKVAFGDSKNLASNTVELPIQYKGKVNLLMKLCTAAGGNAHTWFDTTWWEKPGEVNADDGADGDWESFRDDIKTAEYDEPVGKRIKVIHLDGSKKIATSTYDIYTAFQSKSLRQLVTDAAFTNRDIGNKNAKLSSGKIKDVDGKKYFDSGRAGNCREGDLFADNTKPLRVRASKNFGSNWAMDRLSTRWTNNGCRGHVFGGIGGAHKHGDWGVGYEVMPVVRYCGTENGYGKLKHNYVNVEGQRNNPFINCGGRFGSNKGPNNAVDIAIYRVDV